MRETPGSRIFAGGRRRRRMRAGVRSCATQRAVDNNGVCEQAFDRVCDVSAVNDVVVATGSNDGLSAHPGVKGLCMCDTCDLSALDSAQ